MIASKFSRRWPRGRRLASRALAATVTGGGLAAALAVGLAAAPASALIVPAPATGLAPSVAVVGTSAASTGRVVGYTAGNGTVWLHNLSSGVLTEAGGHLVSAPQLMSEGSSVAVFGEGTDHALWVNTCTQSAVCGGWRSLGGTITSKPATAYYGNGEWWVYARGADGALWSRTHTSSGWGAWHSLGGRLLAGTGPAASYINAPYVLVAGTNHELYIQGPGVTGFNPAGGRTNSTPALTLLPPAQGQPTALVGFARGTDNAGYYHRFVSTTPGWHSMGGRLTSGLAAVTQIVATIPNIYTYGLGTDGRIYEDVSTWAAPTPSLSGWHQAG